MLTRKRPLDETSDTSELLERELENGVQIEWPPSESPQAGTKDTFSSLGGMLVIWEVISVT